MYASSPGGSKLESVYASNPSRHAAHRHLISRRQRRKMTPVGLNSQQQAPRRLVPLSSPVAAACVAALRCPHQPVPILLTRDHPQARGQISRSATPAAVPSSLPVDSSLSLLHGQSSPVRAAQRRRIPAHERRQLRSWRVTLHETIWGAPCVRCAAC